jgi:hypothetical protein
MTSAADMDAAIERILKASCAAQGVPEKITDPAVVAKVATLAKTSTPRHLPTAEGRPADTRTSPTGPPHPSPAPAATTAPGRDSAPDAA